MHKVETRLLIDGIEYKVGDSVEINKIIYSGEIRKKRVKTILRGIDIKEDVIELWFSENNFKGKTFDDDDYDVVAPFLWKNNIDDCIEELDIKHINK